jgi:hypothetical protein
LFINKTLTIDGEASKITISRDTTAQPTRLRLFYVSPAGNLTLKNLTLSGGAARGGDGDVGGAAAGLGGAIVNAGSLTVVSSTIVDCVAQGGSTGGDGVGFGGAGLGGDPSGTFTSSSGGNPNGGSPHNAGGFGGGAGFGGYRGGFGGGGSGGNANTDGSGGFGGGGGNNLGQRPGGFGGGGSLNEGGGGAGLGGAIFNYGGQAVVTNSTLARNAALGGKIDPRQNYTDGNGSGLGGAIFNLNGTVTATNATIANNISPQGGAIYSLGDNGIATQSGPALTATTSTSPAKVTLNNTILSGSNNGANTPASVADYIQNTNNSGNGGGSGFVGSSGANNIVQLPVGPPLGFQGGLTAADPKLNSLGDNGGPTQTMSLQSNSPAIDAGDDCVVNNSCSPALGLAITADQRGYVRKAGSHVDIGAVELTKPVASSDTYSTNEDTTLAVTAVDGVLSNDSSRVNGTLTASLKTSPAHASSFTLNTDGSFSYRSVADYNGGDSFTYTATDAGGTSSAVQVSITVDPVNDAPSFTKGGDQTIGVGAGAQSVDNWATNISAGPADESSQTVSFLLQNDNSSLFTGQPAIDNTGKLTYTPGTSAGSAIVTAQAQDTGGTDRSGHDTSAGQTFTITVNPGAADHFTIIGPTSSTAGDNVLFTVTAFDQYGNNAPDYAGTVHFTTDSAKAVLPANSTLTGGDFGAQLNSAGNRTITATDTVTTSITGTSGTIAVAPAALSRLKVFAPATAEAGVPFEFGVAALDAYNNIVTSYAGTVGFTTTDGKGTLPNAATLSSGVAKFSATLKTAASQTITATDTANSLTAISKGIAVAHAGVTHFIMSAPANATAGQSFNVVVTAVDRFGNTATRYGGFVHFTSNDPAATLPADTYMVAGTGQFSAKLVRLGNNTVRVGNPPHPAITAATRTIAVTAGPIADIAPTAPAE